MYLGALLALVVVIVGGASAYQQSRNLEQATTEAEHAVELRAGLAGRDVDAAIMLTQEAVGSLAANAALAELFVAPTPTGCTLTFTGAGPFPSGHIDIIDREGLALCSSRPLPDGPEYDGAAFVTAEEPGVRGPVDDPASGTQALVVFAPIGDRGVAATFLDLEALEPRLSASFGGDLRADFTLVRGDGDPIEAAATGSSIQGAAPIPSLGWTVSASVDRNLALADARSINRALFVVLLAGLAILIAAVWVLYRGLARPLERLGAALRAGLDDDAPLPGAVTDSAEVMALAEDFVALRRSAALELAGRRDAEARYRRLFASHPLPMWVYDTRTLAFLDVNEAAVADYGYAREEFLAMTIRDLRSADDVPALLGSVASQRPRDRSGPWRHLCKDGRMIEVEISSHAVEFADHDARFVMAEDITQRERARRLAERGQRMESLGLLAGGIAHDFNQQLTIVLGYADLTADSLRSAAAVDPERWERPLAEVEQISQAGRRAAALTQQLLGFARGDAVEVGPVDINEIVTGLEGVLRHTVGHGIELELFLGSDLPSVRANPGQIEQVVVNLAINARDAMAGGGRLLLDTTAIELDEGAQPLSSHPPLAPGRYVRLRVSDSGSGMTIAQRDSAFEPFFTTKDRGVGTGLGLATVYDIVDRAGGSIHLYSELGIGTTVTILLPSEAADAPAEPTPHEPADVPSATILVVDDQIEVLGAVERILVAAGHRVLTVADGPHALELACTDAPIDVLLTDIVLPGMSGKELAARVQELRPGLPTVFMSGYAPPMLLATGRLPSDVPVVDKPFTARAIKHAVASVLVAEVPD